ncbi:acetoacetate decarboxylase family protein [Frankia sp. AiPs1]|uniref:acetoacetate decarboxylase family protein n=1 Tax=Frankia sp. AiPs1 TaxID=573493 RepID=UPI00204440A1|nr:acetoacetate decarboxylase family protein [Frankia sp. AiPs1]MCM3922375.1 acetoacetate decarboxylase family protein [Frankia sp. AiPs1]
MARRALGGTWRVQDRLIRLPVTITDARAAVAVFRSDPAAVRGMLTGTGLTPWTVAGRAVAVLGVVRYGPWVLGSYDEVGVGVAVRGPGGRRGLHLVDLPVTGAFTRDAGRAIWSLPKWLMSAEVDLTDHTTSVTIATGTATEPAAPRHIPTPAPNRASDGDGDGADGRFVLRARLEVGGVRVPFPVPGRIPLWCVLPDGPRAGVLLRGTMPVRLHGVRLGRGRTRVELGSHPMAGRMAALGMTGRPLLTVTASRLRGELGVFTGVGGVDQA